MSLLPFLYQALEGRGLTVEQAQSAMETMLRGEATAAQVAAFLTALRMKGETVEELTGFAQSMRDTSERIEIDQSEQPLLDTCGTGGDASSTFNISTVAALVAAGAGVRVAKHGNRSISSQCGSADLLEALGVRVDLSADQVARSIRDAGIGFMFAPAFHRAMKHIQPVRVELKMRTVFNLLGPLANPAGARAQLVGAPSERAAELMAGALAALGLERGFVVHGSGGLDEVTTTGPTTVFAVERGSIARSVYTPEMFGIAQAAPEALTGGGLTRNCAIALEVLDGAHGPQRDIVLVNAAVALIAAGRASGISMGMALARESIDSGAAFGKLEALRRL